tara:strand:+ start:592 stop:1161 length:570 start_codon:yes stop_codon:yes gene_type:complete
MDKHYIQADQLLKDSFELAWKIFNSDYKPNFIIGVWRGGAPVGIAVQEFLDFLGISSDHIAIRTSYYSGINSTKNEVQVYGLNYVIKQLKSNDSLLIVDDVYDTGKSVSKVVKDLVSACNEDCPEIRIATPYFKPKNNQTDRVPDYFIHETDQWLVFPHELQGLSIEEIKANKPELGPLIKKIELLKSK